MTLNRHWGWHKMDQNWKSTQQLVQTLVDVASKGGNFLLNVGPTGEGEIPAPSIERLAEVGRILASGMAKGEVSPEDRAYLIKVVGAQTGLSPQEAEQRVNEVLTQARNAATAVAEQPREWATTACAGPCTAATARRAAANSRIVLLRGPLGPGADWPWLGASNATTR